MRFFKGQVLHDHVTNTDVTVTDVSDQGIIVVSNLGRVLNYIKWGSVTVVEPKVPPPEVDQLFI